MDVNLTLYSKVIRSSLPGRLRIRLPMLKGADTETTKFVSDWLKSHASSIEVIVNPRVGSALITWDPAHDSLDIESLLNEAADYLQTAQTLGLIAPQDCESQSLGMTSVKKWKNVLSSQGEQIGNRLLDALSPWVAADVKQSARKRRVTQNRLMLASLIASIGVLGTSRSKSHVTFGVGFIALLCIHLLQHRKVL
ncbi:MAG TPA: hypothetical protein IAC65_03705 [Candidatus Aphodousia faecipullorum]|nr:hypothetical protein [Candidatus Aphodousia faecipullorum]